MASLKAPKREHTVEGAMRSSMTDCRAGVRDRRPLLTADIQKPIV